MTEILGLLLLALTTIGSVLYDVTCLREGRDW